MTYGRNSHKKQARLHSFPSQREYKDKHGQKTVQWNPMCVSKSKHAQNNVQYVQCTKIRTNKHETFHVHAHKVETLYSPWRGCGSWPVLQRNPPHWLSGGQRQNSCLCSRRAFACSCASWTVFHTAPGHACRSREKNRVKGKGEKYISHTDKTFKSYCNQHYSDTSQICPPVKKQSIERNDHSKSFIAFKKPTHVKVSETKHWTKKGQRQSNVLLQ